MLCSYMSQWPQILSIDLIIHHPLQLKLLLNEILLFNPFISNKLIRFGIQFIHIDLHYMISIIIDHLIASFVVYKILYNIIL